MDKRRRKRRAEDTQADGDTHRLKRPMPGVVPSPPSPPADSNDREVSMILGHPDTQRESPRNSQTSSQHYSKHSSLMTDLSLTPSPPAQQPPSSQKHEHQPRDVDTPDNDDDDDSDDGSKSTSSSSSGSSFDNQPPSRPADDCLTTPQVTRCSEELTDDISQSPPASPHFNTPDLATDTEAVMMEPGLNLASFQHRDILGLQGPASSSSLSLSLDLPSSSSTPKPCSGINNNLVASSPGLASPYCSPSPAYSIPSPGSAFSVVISRRRESES